MKEFWKMVLAVLVGLLLLSVISTIVSIGMLGSLAMNGEAPVKMPKSFVLKVDMSELNITEQTVDLGFLSSFEIDQPAVVGLWDAVRTVEKAAEDPAVKCIYLKTDNCATSLSAVEEFRQALSDFRKSGKPVIAFVESLTAGGCYLASVADKVYMSEYPGANYMFGGLSSQLIYLKDLLDKLGVNVQLIRHGKYKSAGEMFIRNDASPENIEQYQVMLNSVWASVSEEICSSRGIQLEDLNECVSELGLCFPEDFVKAGLCDELVTREELKERLAVFAQESEFSDVKLVPFLKYKSSVVQPSLPVGDKIAVVYANGEIIDRASAREQVAVVGDEFAAMIADARADSTVKAVVLRVNSPGGSVIASDKIREEIALTKSVKPVVASYGDYAASGGYWISAGCDKIFSDKTTLTGSIGVFGMIPDFSKTLKNIIHINMVAVKTHPHADMYSLTRPLDAVETEYIQKSIEDVYERFVGIVADGRGLEKEYVDEIGQGRVWTGRDALGKGLIDEYGTLADAIHYAAALAGKPSMADWTLVDYPAAPTALDMILSMLGGDDQLEEDIFAGTAFSGVAAGFKDWYSALSGRRQGNYIYARMPFVCDIR